MQPEFYFSALSVSWGLYTSNFMPQLIGPEVPTKKATYKMIRLIFSVYSGGGLWFRCRFMSPGAVLVRKLCILVTGYAVAIDLTTLSDTFSASRR